MPLTWRLQAPPWRPFSQLLRVALAACRLHLPKPLGRALRLRTLLPCRHGAQSAHLNHRGVVTVGHLSRHGVGGRLMRILARRWLHLRPWSRLAVHAQMPSRSRLRHGDHHLPGSLVRRLEMPRSHSREATSRRAARHLLSIIASITSIDVIAIAEERKAARAAGAAGQGTPSTIAAADEVAGAAGAALDWKQLTFLKQMLKVL